MTRDFRFSAIKDAYHAHSDSMKFDLAQPSVVCTFRRRNTPQEHILSIGQTQNEIQRDPTYQKVAIQGEIRFCDPFDPRTFNAFLAEAVVRYYVAKATNTRNTLAKLLMMITGGKLDVLLDLSGYASVSPEKQDDFEARLSKALLIRTWRIMQKPNQPSEGTR